MKASLIGIMSLGLCTACISVSVTPPKSERASGVRAVAPPAPFLKSNSDAVDELWRNPKNGNAISYVSDCGDTSEPTLKTIEQGVSASLAPYSYLEQKDLTFEGRAARRVKVKGSVDGVSSVADFLVFKKNNCIFILTFSGVESKHDQDQKAFESFLSGFHSP